MKKKIITFLSIFCLCAVFISAKDLTGIDIQFTDTHLEISTWKHLHNVRFRLNGDYTYEVKDLPIGDYTAGLATFVDKKGNRFNPFATKALRVSVFCDEGSTYFTAR